MAGCFVDVDGEVAALEPGSRAGLIARLLEVDGSSLADRLAAGALVRLTRDESLLVATVVGLWHAEEGVLPADLCALRDAAGAAGLRQEIVPR